MRGCCVLGCNAPYRDPSPRLEPAARFYARAVPGRRFAHAPLIREQVCFEVREGVNDLQISIAD